MNASCLISRSLVGWKELAELLFPLQVGTPTKSSCVGVVSVDIVTSKERSMVGNV